MVSGALEQPTAGELPNDVINSNFSGSYVITVTSARRCTSCGFGYDSDTGAGTYTMNYADGRHSAGDQLTSDWLT